MRKRKTPRPPDLTPTERRDLVRWLGSQVRAGTLPRAYHAPAKLRALVDACLDHHEKHGHEFVSWPAACRQWIRKQAEIDGYRQRPRSRPRPRPKTQDLFPDDAAAAGHLSSIADEIARVQDEVKR